MHGTCYICGRQFSDTTTCPNCSRAFISDLQTHQKQLATAGLSGMAFDEWAQFVIDGKKKSAGEITNAEFERRKKRNIEAVKKRLKDKAENERKLASKDILDHRNDAYN